MGISMDGLASKLDTSAIINALMDVEKIPRTMLSAKADDRKFVISQLQSLNTSLQELFTRASSLAASGGTTALTATSSDEAVRVTARPGAAVISTSLIVDRVAAAHSIVTAPVAGFTDVPLVLTVEGADGTLVEVRPTSGSPRDVAAALTGAGLGITAVAVPSGTDAGGAPLSRLQVTADETGAAAAFRLHLGDAAAVSGGLAVDLAATPGAAVVATGSDAQLRLWAGTDAEQTITSAGNVFTDLFPDVDVTVTRATADPVTVGVAADTAARTKTVSDFVAQIAQVLSGIAKGSSATVGTGAGETTRLGVFTGDSTVRALRQALTTAVQHPVDGQSPSTIGISIDRYGVLSFDAAAFTKALTERPDQVTAIFSGVAARVETVTEQYSDKYDGLLTARITGQQNEVTQIDEQLDRWDVRLAQRRSTLERTYAAMETLLSRLQSQQSYLTSQLDGLSGLRQSS